MKTKTVTFTTSSSGNSGSLGLKIDEVVPIAYVGIGNVYRFITYRTTSNNVGVSVILCENNTVSLIPNTEVTVKVFYLELP